MLRDSHAIAIAALKPLFSYLVAETLSRLQRMKKGAQKTEEVPREGVVEGSSFQLSTETKEVSRVSGGC